MKVAGKSHDDHSSDTPTICLFDYSQYKNRIKSLSRDQSQTTNSFIDNPIRDKKAIDRDQIVIARARLNKLHPNFKEVTNSIFDNLLLSTLSLTKGASFQPVLILGDPGIGKTFYANSLAKELGLPKISVDFSTTTSGFVLSGTSSKWGNASVGVIAKMLLSEQTANGIVLIDEIDKAGDSPGSGGNPVNSLLTLLETHSAKQFIDEFLDLPLDASHLNYIATANDISGLPPQIKSRFTIFEVKKPTVNEIIEITRNAYKYIIKDLEIDDVFEPELSEECVYTIAREGDVRSLKKVIVSSIISAVKADQLEVLAKDIHIEFQSENDRRGIGFLAP